MPHFPRDDSDKCKLLLRYGEGCPKIVLTLLICTSLLIGGIAVAGDRYGKQKVVYHINYDDPKAQAAASLVVVQK